MKNETKFEKCMAKLHSCKDEEIPQLVDELSNALHLYKWEKEMAQQFVVPIVQQFKDETYQNFKENVHTFLKNNGYASN